MANAIEAPAWLGLAVALATLFPDGRPIGPRWRLLLVAQLPLAVLTLVGLALSPGPLVFFAFFDNPHAISGAAGTLAFTAAAVGIGLIGV